MKIIAAFEVDPVDPPRVDPCEVIAEIADCSMTVVTDADNEQNMLHSKVTFVHAEWENGGLQPLEVLMTAYDGAYPDASPFSRGSVKHEHEKTLSALADAGFLILPPSSFA